MASAVANSKAVLPYWSDFFSVRHLFPHKKACSSLCAFAINDDKADTPSSTLSVSKLLDRPLGTCPSQMAGHGGITSRTANKKLTKLH